MPARTLSFLLSTLFAIVIYSCNSTTGKKALLPWTDKVDIYVAGEETDTATYWKNGEAVHLGKTPGEATSIAISGRDVYVAGYLLMCSQDSLTTYVRDGIHYTDDCRNFSGVALYWKNGIPTLLTDKKFDASATSIVVSKDDVYVAGYVYDGQKTGKNPDDKPKSVAKYWKNGVPVTLTDGSEDAAANYIAVNKSDVYVVGYENEKGIMTARCWKNGKKISLKIDSNLIPYYKSSEARSIFFADDDIYIAGQEGGLAAYWKNGIPVLLVPKPDLNLPDLEIDQSNSVATSIFVSNKNIYAAGIQDTLLALNKVVKYWKNGKDVSLTKAPTDVKSKASLVTVFGDDVYVTSTTASRSSNFQSTIWRNNIPVVLTKKTAYVSAIVVVKK